MFYAQSTFSHIQDVYDWEMLPATVRVKGHYTLDDIQNTLMEEQDGLPTLGIPVEFARDQIQSGTMVSKQTTDCLVLKNAQHLTDYFYFVFTTRITGNMTSIGIQRAGGSDLLGQWNKKQDRKKSESLLINIVGALTKTNDQAMAQEEDYYQMVADVIKTQLGIQ